MKFLPVWLTLLLLSAPDPVARAADYQGAAAALKQMEEVSQQVAAAEKSDTLAAFQAALKDFRAKAAALTPEAAAHAWLELFDRAENLNSPNVVIASGTQLKQTVRDVFLVLPPPEAWPALAEEIRARPVTGSENAGFPVQGLRLIAAALLKEEDPTWEAMDELTASAHGDSQAQTALTTLRAALSVASDEPRHALAAFMAQTSADPAPPPPPKGEDQPPADPAQDGDQPTPPGEDRNKIGALELPDLVALAGPERAETLLRRTFTLPFASLNISSLPANGPTLTLARRVALEMARGKLAFAPWELARHLDATDLYEALRRRAEAGESRFVSSDGQISAYPYYVLGLVKRGRAEEALALALKGDEYENWPDADDGAFTAPLEQMADAGQAGAAAAFFRQVLEKQKQPGAATVQLCLDAAALAGETDAMLARVLPLTEKPDPEDERSPTLRYVCAQALLAASRAPEGVRLWRDLLAEDSGKIDREALALNLARLGVLLGDPALAGEGMDALLKARAAAAGASADETPASIDPGWDEIFLAAGRGPELERLRIDHWLDAKRGKLREDQSDNARTANEPPERGDSSPFGTLSRLAGFYDAAGRPADVLALFDRAEDWGVDDLARLFGRDDPHGAALPLARALRAAGRREEALRVVNVYLEAEGGSDPGYALLLELTGDAGRSLARLDELFARDPFEERPLIWKAQILAGQGKLPEAEACARRAIAIDPTDGEEGRGDRLRAYSVLSDILRREQQPGEADRLAGAVRAIRQAEEADRFLEAGLRTRAVELYQKALESFADDYSIHLRLAIQLAALGRADEAATHYERAYELMPGCFGRMNGACSGCEDSFHGERARVIAEKVFLKQTAREPGKPQGHYLLGCLREAQGRNAEAAGAFREAVRLDPDYLNAWKHLADAAVLSADQDTATLNLLRLDPRLRHASPDLTLVNDLPALWRAVAAARKSLLAAPREVYPLPASKAARTKAAQRAAEESGEPPDTKEPDAAGSGQSPSLPATPQEAILNNAVISNALQLSNREEREAITY